MGIPKNWNRLKEGDHFTFTIDLVEEDDTVIEQVAGANSVIAAQAAYRVLPPYYGPGDILRIRQGSRIMDRTRGTDEERLKAVAQMVAMAALHRGERE